MHSEPSGLAMDTFGTADIYSLLEAHDLSGLDDLEFGVIALDASDRVVGYNRYEADRAGLSPDRVLGLEFFSEVAPCTNNYLIRQRFDDESELDEFVDYVFTLRMAPTPVRLRLLAREQSPLRYLLVRNR